MLINQMIIMKDETYSTILCNYLRFLTCKSIRKKQIYGNDSFLRCFLLYCYFLLIKLSYCQKNNSRWGPSFITVVPCNLIICLCYRFMREIESNTTRLYECPLFFRFSKDRINPSKQLVKLIIKQKQNKKFETFECRTLDKIQLIMNFIFTKFSKLKAMKKRNCTYNTVFTIKADSEWVILFERYFEQKMALTTFVLGNIGYLYHRIVIHQIQ